MTHHREWLERAERFVAGLASLPGKTAVHVHVEPPLTQHDADALARRLPQGLPKPIYDFVTRGSAGCDCHYVWEPPEGLYPELKEIFTYEDVIYGGPVLCDVRQFAGCVRPYQRQCFSISSTNSRRFSLILYLSTPVFLSSAMRINVRNDDH